MMGKRWMLEEGKNISEGQSSRNRRGKLVEWVGGGQRKGRWNNSECQYWKSRWSQRRRQREGFSFRKNVIKFTSADPHRSGARVRGAERISPGVRPSCAPTLSIDPGLLIHAVNHSAPRPTGQKNRPITPDHHLRSRNSRANLSAPPTPHPPFRSTSPLKTHTSA